jgi:hypothetical protein
VAGPESIQPKDPNKPAYSKWLVVMENGSTMATFAEKCADAVDKLLDQELTFEVELSDGGFPPKILKVLNGDTVVYEKSSGGGPGQRQWVDTTPSQNARHALGSASATLGQLEAARIAAGKPEVAVEQLLLDVDRLAHGYLEIINDLS